jgi:hypothetical protein
VELDPDSAPLGAVSIEADMADPQQGDNARSSLCDLVVHGASLGMPERTNLGDAIPAPGPSGAGDPRLTGLILSGPPSPRSSSASINQRQVEDNVEYACSQITITKRLLREMLASVSQNILHLIRVSLRKEGYFYLGASGFLRDFSFPTTFASTALVLG